MARYSREPNDCKVYVGDLQKDASEKELERAFAYYGRLKSVWVARNPPGFAFVEFEDYRDAEDAVRGLDGTYMCGGRARVELSTGKVRPKPWARGGRGGGGGGGGGGSRRRAFNPEDRCYECGDRGHYAYDCSKSRGGRGHGGSGGSGGGGSRSSRRRSRSYSRSYSRSRSRDRGRRDSYSKSRSPQPRSRSRSASRHSN